MNNMTKKYVSNSLVIVNLIAFIKNVTKLYQKVILFIFKFTLSRSSEV